MYILERRETAKMPLPTNSSSFFSSTINLIQPHAKTAQQFNVAILLGETRLTEIFAYIKWREIRARIVVLLTISFTSRRASKQIRCCIECLNIKVNRGQEVDMEFNRWPCWRISGSESLKGQQSERNTKTSL